MAYTPYHCKNSKVRVNSVTIVCKQWDVQYEADELDTTNFEGSGYHECIGGIKKITATIVFDNDGTANYFTSPGFVAGSTVSTVKLYENDTTGPYWSIPTALVRSVTPRADVKQQMTTSVTLVGTGTFAYPSGNAVS